MEEVDYDYYSIISKINYLPYQKQNFIEMVKPAATDFITRIREFTGFPLQFDQVITKYKINSFKQVLQILLFE